MRKKSLIVLLLLSTMLGLSACENIENPVKENNEEIIEDTISPKEDAIWSRKFENSDKRSELMEKMTELEVSDTNEITFTYDGVKREGLIFFPENVKDSSLIVMLHGGGMTIDNFVDMTNINDEATSRGYTVLYLQGLDDSTNASSVYQWNNGSGLSTVDDLGFIQSAALSIEEKYELNVYNTNVIGFSNGAFMVHTLASEGCDTFEGFVSVAGGMQKPSWDKKDDILDLSFLAIYGLKDSEVPIKENGSSQYAIDPAIEDTLLYYATTQDLSTETTILLTDKVTEYTYSSQNSSNIVKGISIKDCHHGWPDEKLTTFNTNEYILNFLDSIKE